ncbi:MAG TPA: DUF4159 domain-containing protein [Humisphaera sp.]|nr:DUF4159 domain-containing protein [Humisphaera sp.]
MLRRGVSDGDVIYDTIARGSRVRMLDALDPNALDPTARLAERQSYAHVRTEDGRDGLIIPARLKALLMPVPQIEHPAIMARVVHPISMATQPTPLPPYSRLGRTRSIQQVSAAIAKATQNLESLQRSGGGWEAWAELGTHRNTALIAATIIAAKGTEFEGQSKAKEALTREGPESEVATLAFRDEFFNRRRDVPATSSGAATLLDVVAARQPEFADTFFGRSIGSDTEDPVDSYRALRAISNAAVKGVEVPAKFWKTSDAQWRKKQAEDGGWPSGTFYQPAPSDFQGTAAGFLALSLTGERLLDDRSEQFSRHTGNYVDANVQAAAGWLNQHMPDVWNDIRRGNSERPCETLWWLDQVMSEAGAIRIDRRDSVTQMLQWLLDAQNFDGSWPGKLSETAYAVRILLNHMRPPGIAKLAYDSGPWNQRPNDVRHLSRWLGRNLFGSDATRWLIVDIDDPQEDFDTLPILYIAGDADFQFTRRQQDKLRNYVEQGGLIVGNADQGAVDFNKAFKSLGAALFPRYEFSSLPAAHPIFADQHYSLNKGGWKNGGKLIGLSNGVRDLMLLIPDADPSLNWQNNQTTSRAQAFELAGNIMLYAVGQGPVSFSREFPMPLAPAKLTGKDLKVARIQVGDNWNPEPGAWPRMDDIMQARDGLRLDLRESRLEPGSLSDCSFAHLTGTTHFSLTPRQRQVLHDFVTGGGTLLIDAAGGSAEFADSAQSELQAMFGDDRRQDATLMQPEILFAKPDVPAPLEGKQQVYRRQVQLLSPAGGRTPRFRVISLGNRMAVFFSREDLTAAMAGIESDNIDGYRPEIGVDLVRGMLLYAGKNP